MSGTTDPATPSRWRRDLLIAVVTATVTLAGAWVLFGDDDDGGGGGDRVESGPSTTTSPPDDESRPGETTSSTSGVPEPGTIPPGTFTVGRDIEPGRYIAFGYSGGCDWQRLADTTSNQVIAEDELVRNQAIVEILSTDTAFFSDGCGTWETYEPAASAPFTVFEDGDWLVGDQIEPGSYHSEGAQVGLCTWTRASGFEHTAQEVIETRDLFSDAATEVATLTEGERFTSKDCTRWVKIG